ncbi:Putative small-subunit processome, Utp14 protein [Septoria linicola]|uniref:Small-subunit processome, Utp14 protein n=1 Tax=Septoria linicola TaxID=215465 RepID=A0A9Q9AM81_9PEZI|nr:Putative small-subunit processome, Utp14 protein [Septoria linicola]
MPARVARSSVPSNVPGKGKTAKNKSKKRSLDAYARAEKLVPEQRLGIAKHRLGEFEDDGPRQKRRRQDSDEDDDEDEDEAPQRKRPTQRRVNEPNGDVEYGSDSSGNEWTMGGLAEDDDDSDLDSDAAFGDSDEEKFEGFTFRGSKNLKGKKSKGGREPKKRQIDLDEKGQDEDDSGDSQDEEGLGFGDDAVDLAAMLDDPGSDDNGQEEGSGSEDDYEEGDDSESESEEDDDDADDEEKAARMRDRLEALEAKSSKRKPAALDSGADVDMDDLFADFAEDVAPEKSKKAKKRAQQGPISAPLPKRQQDRIDREVATAKAKETLDRWKNTVIQNRRAENLSFPLQHPDDTGVTVGKEKFTPSSLGAPANELEASIQRIMEESGLATQRDAEVGAADDEDEEAALLKAEGMAEKNLDVEEVMRRRAELRKQRALLFREEIKAKRIAKIKSKSYRRVHRKERERAKEQAQLAMGGLGYDDMDEDAKEKHDRQRAEARMSTRHKDSKWAKSLKQTNRTAWDDSARDGAVEQARRNEELKKRMAGKDVSDDEGSLSPASEDDDEISADKLDALQKESGSNKGLAGLKFMQKSDEKRRKANDEAVERIRRDLAIADGDEQESEEEDEGLGRAIFGPSSKEQKRQVRQRQEFEAPDDSDEEAEQREAAEAGIVVDKPTARDAATKGIPKKSSAASGPLAKGVLKQPSAKESGKEYGGWLSTGDSKSKNANAAVDADTINPSTVVPVASKPAKAGIGYDETKKKATSTAGNTNGWTTVSYKTGDDNANLDEDASDAEPTNAILTPQEKTKASLQERAFAGDDVLATFTAEKDALIASEDEQEISTHLPGWGSWTGEGLSKKIRKANKTAAHNPLYKTKLAGVRAADRKDAHLDKVIVSEKQDRKGKKYLAPVLPHEFETREQYERSRRLPMGPEWTTKEVHQKMTRPRVIVKRGVNVEALGKPIA